METMKPVRNVKDLTDRELIEAYRHVIADEDGYLEIIAELNRRNQLGCS
jgi:hypothetical protein